MLTETRRKTSSPFGDLEVVRYPDEFVEELEKEAELAALQVRTGELQYISLEDFARELGVNFKR